MLSETLDTIVAIATPPGVGGIGIIRISGELALFIAQSMLQDRASKLTPNQAVYADFLAADGKVLDRGIVIFFKSPHSFTGEDVIEFHGHGGPIILKILLSRIRFLGARLAEPGEFSKRAFLNGKIDLLQAEGIASLIHAQTEQAALAAAKTLQGAFSEKINHIVNDLIEVRMHLEAMINFPEDDIDNRNYDQLYQQTNNLQDKIMSLLAAAKQGKLLDNGIRALILGKPNVGKSSLLNLLLGEDRVIVTNIPGTTRDLVSYKVNLDGLVIDFADTAGMRLTDDLVEQIGIQKAIQEIKIADLIVLIKTAEEIDMTQVDSLELKDFLPVNITLELLANKKIILLINKIDLYQSDPKVIVKDNTAIILISTLYDQGIELFKQIIKQNLDFSSEALPFIAKERHIAALQQVRENILLSQQILINDHTLLDLFAEELRLAQEGLSQITGTFSNEDLLNKIFAEFCIGK